MSSMYTDIISGQIRRTGLHLTNGDDLVELGESCLVVFRVAIVFSSLFVRTHWLSLMILNRECPCVILSRVRLRGEYYIQPVFANP